MSALPWYTSDDGQFVLYQGDSLELLGEVAAARDVRAIFADPPYFLSNDGVTCQAGKMVSVNKGGWDRLTTVEDMHEFNTRWLALCQAALHPDGTIWVSGTRHVIFSIGFAMQQLGYKALNDIVWEKPNPPPNLSCRYFTHSTELLLWAAANSKSRHTFNYSAMRAANDGKQMKSVWKMTAPGAAEKVQGRHPTQKPVALLERILLASTAAGDLVLDPFNGSGTTGIAASRLGRRYIGIEREEEYLELTKKRYLADRDATPLFGDLRLSSPDATRRDEDGFDGVSEQSIDGEAHVDDPA